MRYRIFLDILRISRNRKMASLQRAKELKRRGLKRWQSNSLVSPAACSVLRLRLLCTSPLVYPDLQFILWFLTLPREMT